MLARFFLIPEITIVAERSVFDDGGIIGGELVAVFQVVAPREVPLVGGRAHEIVPVDNVKRAEAEVVFSIFAGGEEGEPVDGGLSDDDRVKFVIDAAGDGCFACLLNEFAVDVDGCVRMTKFVVEDQLPGIAGQAVSSEDEMHRRVSFR